jgi:hypothetical protein
VILGKVFNTRLLTDFVPASFYQSYTLPLLKTKTVDRMQSLATTYRGIALSSVLSKTFVKCLLEVFVDNLFTEDNQFGF